MKKNVLIAAIILIILLFVIQGDIANGIFLFLLTGAVVGTPISVPFWMMMAIYSALIALITTDVVESVFTLHKTSRQNELRKDRMPRRRYGNL